MIFIQNLQQKYFFLKKFFYKFKDIIETSKSSKILLKQSKRYQDQSAMHVGWWPDPKIDPGCKNRNLRPVLQGPLFLVLSFLASSRLFLKQSTKFNYIFFNLA